MEMVAVGSTVVTEVTMAVVAAAWVEILAVVVMAPAVRMATGAAVQASPRHSNGDHGSRLSQTRTATESLPNPDGSKHLLSRKSLGNLLGFLSSQPSTQHLRLIAQGVGVVVAREVAAALVEVGPLGVEVVEEMVAVVATVETMVRAEMAREMVAEVKREAVEAVEAEVLVEVVE